MGNSVLTANHNGEGLLPVSNDPQTGDNERVLIIDDDEILAMNLEDFLTDKGYNAYSINDSGQGMMAALRQTPDAVLLDIQMPRKNGLEVLSVLHERYPELPVIIISGAGNINQLIKALRLGAWDYIAKPFVNMDIILHSLKRTLEKSRLLKQNRYYEENLEKLVEHSSAKLRVSERRHRLISEIISDVVYTSKLNKQNSETLEWYSGNLEKLLGGKLDESTLNNGFISSLIHPQDLHHWHHMRKQLTATGDFYLDYRVICPDGKVRWLREQARPMFDAADDVGVQIVGAISDITHEKGMQQQLVQMQKMEALGTLAGGIAHDFNNILGAIFGYSELLEEQLNGNQLLLPMVNEILKASMRAKELVKQILSFSRRSKGNNVPVRLKDVVKDTIKMLHASLPKTVELVHQISSDGLVLADPTNMHQIIMNLVTNSYHALPEERGTIVVTLEELNYEQLPLDVAAKLHEANWVRLTVQDNGSGIIPENLEKIFDPYFTTKKSGQGTGLGLSIIHSIITRMHGTIEVDTVLGQGTKFDIYLPQSKDQALANEVAPAAAINGNAKVLFVDDEKQIEESIRQYLVNHGYRVSAFTSPQEALQEFESNPDSYDFVVTDYRMPGLNGDQLARQTLALSQKVKVVICSGSGDLSNTIKEQLGPRCQHMAKPLGGKELVIKLHEMHNVSS